MSSGEIREPFAADLIEAVAAECSVEMDRLVALLSDHQALMDRLPGVENLVYEWRKQFGATVVERSEEWYFVAAPEWAWEEFGEELSADESEMAALAAIHARTVREHPDVPASALEGTAPMVLLRT